MKNYQKFSNKIEIPQKSMDELSSIPESGMGYHTVNVQLKDGNVLPNRIVMNSTYLLLLENEKIKTEDIFRIMVI
jgi:hypothetical protein